MHIFVHMEFWAAFMVYWYKLKDISLFLQCSYNYIGGTVCNTHWLFAYDPLICVKVYWTWSLLLTGCMLVCAGLTCGLETTALVADIYFVSNDKFNITWMQHWIKKCIKQLLKRDIYLKFMQTNIVSGWKDVTSKTTTDCYDLLRRFSVIILFDALQFLRRTGRTWLIWSWVFFTLCISGVSATTLKPLPLFFSKFSL